MTRAHYHDLLWDYVYGLLDQPEAQELSAHVAGCGECRAALAEAQDRQKMLARAARIVHDVPVFIPPGHPTEPAVPAPTLPLHPPEPRRSALRRFWPAWAAAAALLAAGLGLHEVYQRALSRQDVVVAEARRELDAVQGRFASLQARVARRKEENVRVEETPPVAEPTQASHLALNKSIYSVGEVLFFRSLTLDRFNLTPPAQPVPLQFSLVDGQGQTVKQEPAQTGPGGVSGGELALTPDLQGGNYSFQVSAAEGATTHLLPRTTSLEIVGHDGVPKYQPVPIKAVATSEKKIDFFPEGGDLVAGVPNRVYYQVRTPQGEPVSPEKNVVILAGKNVLYKSGPKQGLGYFNFTPDAKENYSVQIIDAQHVSEFQGPFERLGIKTEGLVLHAPKSVGREGDPIALILRNQGTARRLLLQVTCRGQIVHQQYLDLPAGNRTVQLQPASGVAGVLQVTALEAGSERLVPLAERLVFLAPTKRLDITCQIANGPGPYLPGTNIDMNLKAVDEHKKALPTYMLAAVVDEKFRDKNERSLAAHFYLAGDFTGAGLDNANLLLNDTPASQEALDLFLGTQGWRRFVPGDPGAFLAANQNQLNSSAQGALPANAGHLSVQSAAPNLQRSLQLAQKDVDEFIERANQERVKLTEEREVDQQVLDRALLASAEIQRLPGEYSRLALGALVLGLLATGCLFLMAGLVRLLRKQDRPTAQFGGAFCCLFACAVLYLMAGRAAQGEIAPAAGPMVAQIQAWPEFTTENLQVATTSPTSRPAGPPAAPSARPAGLLAKQAEGRTEAKKSDAIAPLTRAAGLASAARAQQNEALFARALNLGANPVLSNSITDAQRALLDSIKNNEEMQRRYEMASSKAKDSAASPKAEARGAGGFGGGAPKAAAGGGGGFGGGGLDVGKGKITSSTGIAWNYLREYAHKKPRQPTRFDLQDTLLWHPTLFSADGTAQVSFDLSQNQANYRILIYANSPDGRLGFYEGHLEVRAEKQK